MFLKILHETTLAFAQKYNRRKVIYGHLHKDISQIFSMLCNRKGVRIIEAEMCPNHAHMLVEIQNIDMGTDVSGAADIMQIPQEKCKEDSRIYSKSIKREFEI